MFGVYLMLIFGFVGYFMKKFDYSFVTFVVGYVLGPMAELTIRQSMIISDANPAALLDHPIAILFLVLTVLSIWRFAIAGSRSMQAGPLPAETTPRETGPAEGRPADSRKP